MNATPKFRGEEIGGNWPQLLTGRGTTSRADCCRWTLVLCEFDCVWFTS